ncbi:hypothetical protein Ccrd_020245 [Cynara cardunculus var. scolymus]|uniref:Uncharacterized protein n=1 Tax=Cynara cardunculus var. scolymus TaxID=59895 RepID=A0A118K0J1_CYNCS|nr:hypothetical protein Ccrd_020245 [Cynara cardunculus var. scolymus]
MERCEVINIRKNLHIKYLFVNVYVVYLLDFHIHLCLYFEPSPHSPIVLLTMSSSPFSNSFGSVIHPTPFAVIAALSFDARSTIAITVGLVQNCDNGDNITGSDVVVILGGVTSTTANPLFKSNPPVGSLRTSCIDLTVTVRVRRQTQFGDEFGMINNRRSLPQAHSFTFQSSAVTYGCSNGAYYTNSTTRRTGNDGLRIEEYKEADSTTGQAAHRLLRGIHDKAFSGFAMSLIDGGDEGHTSAKHVNDLDFPLCATRSKCSRGTMENVLLQYYSGLSASPSRSSSSSLLLPIDELPDELQSSSMILMNFVAPTVPKIPPSPTPPWLVIKVSGEGINDIRQPPPTPSKLSFIRSI